MKIINNSSWKWKKLPRKKWKWCRYLRENHKEFIKNYKLILKSKQRLTSEKHIAFTKEVNEIKLSANDDEKIKSIDLIETYAYGTSKDLVC